MPEDIERPTISFWTKAIICGLAVIGLFTIVKWAIAAVFGVLWVLLIVAIVLAVAYGLRGAARRGPRGNGS